MSNRQALKRRFGLSDSTIRYLERSGYVKPNDRSSYDFRELLVLRTVGALQAAKLPTRSIHRALTHLRPWLSDGRPMTRLALEAMDEAIVVRDGDSRWEPHSGQYALPLEFNVLESKILPMKKRSPPGPIATAHHHYLRGADLEANDAHAAKAAYESCLAGDCSHMNARINLGRLLHLEGKHREAEAMYRDTKEPDAILFFNLGVVLEDQGKPADAANAYRDALAHDPALGDAHFNLALLLERAGETQAAFRHLLAYRRLLHIHGSEQR